MSPQSTARRRAAVVAGAPLILFTAMALHPYLAGRQPNVDALAAAVSSDPNRWGLVHLATGLGSAVLAVAFLLVRTHLSGAGEDRWSRAGLPLVMVGCALYAMLPAMELAPLAALESGATQPRPRKRCSPGSCRCCSPAGSPSAPALLLRGGRDAQRCVEPRTCQARRGSPGRDGSVPLRTAVGRPVLPAGPGLLRRPPAPGLFHVAACRSTTRPRSRRHPASAPAARMGPDMSPRFVAIAGDRSDDTPRETQGGCGPHPLPLGSVEDPRALVTRGLHGRSSKPIYLGCAVALGLAGATPSAWMLAGLPGGRGATPSVGAARGAVAARALR